MGLRLLIFLKLLKEGQHESSNISRVFFKYWYGRMGLILIQQPYMIGPGICLNLRESPSTGLLQEQQSSIFLRGCLLGQ